MGRWSSDIYEIYCRMSEQSALGVGTSIASAVVSEIDGPGFHEEHLELQPSEVTRFCELAGDIIEEEEAV